MINQIEDENGCITQNPKEINETLKKFYINLYKSESPEDLSTIDTFLNNTELPKLNQDDQRYLDSPFTLKEIENALATLQSNKSPGEDGFPLEFYKEFRDLLLPLLMDVINLASKTQNLPDSFSTAIITVIHKKKKGPLKCSSFRPISLLNADYKLISKALANRLSKFLPKLINPDQVGFI